MYSAHKRVLYDPEWQSLRVSLLARNNRAGGFATLEGTKSNLVRLTAYLEAAESEQEEINRLWRILNLLNATRMGFSGQKQTGTPKDKAVQTFRDAVQKKYNAHTAKGKSIKASDETTVTQGLQRLPKAQRQKILQDLTKRQKQSGFSEARPELHKFVKQVKESLTGE